MRPSSAKAKGRRCAAEAREALLAHVPGLQPDDIWVVPSGVTGRDLRFSPYAKRFFPFATECKNVERLNIWEAIDQARRHMQVPDEIPLVIFKRNHQKLMACLPLDDLLKLMGKADLPKKDGL
jgi:hypothetical protein